ncbi:MAG: pyroglutamyl-peptidase I [Lachnospiraceae bacterium]
MKVLITGFEPFGGEKVNPAWEAVRMLPDTIAGAEIVKLQIPTVFSESVHAVEAGICTYYPDVVISVGQAGGRSCVTVEKVAINLADARIPDNAGEQPVDEPLQTDGPAAYFATIPVKNIVANVRSHGIPCHISYTAGTYVCNCVMYQVLHLASVRYPDIRAGFIHVPFSAEQAVEKPAGTPFMPLAAIAESLKYAVEACIPETSRRKDR